ncbi:hypothetical protein ABID93_000836 [Pseudomonas trivialis]
MVDTKKSYEPANHGPIEVQLAQQSRLHRWPEYPHLLDNHRVPPVASGLAPRWAA